jgi:hypothetical protein
MQLFPVPFKVTCSLCVLTVYLHPYAVVFFILGTLFYLKTVICGVADPVAARSEVRALIARTLDRGFKSRSRHGCLSASFCAVLSCVGREALRRADHSSKESYHVSK